jgi:hypothetical protein
MSALTLTCLDAERLFSSLQMITASESKMSTKKKKRLDGYIVRT